MNHRPTFRTSFARKGVQAEIAALKAAHRDPADLSRKVAEFQAWQDLKKRGVLAPYVKVGER
jgi:hypothetical protein